MLQKTNTTNAKWIVVESNDKRYSRIKVLKTVAEALEKELKERLDVHEVAIVSILQRVLDLIETPALPDRPRKHIGFKIR